MDKQCWLPAQQNTKYEKHSFNILRFANRVEQFSQTFENLGGAMGALFSSFIRKRQQRKASRNLIKENLKQLREYGLALDRELEFANGHIQELLNQDFPGSSISLSSLSDHLDSLSLCSMQDVLEGGVRMACSSKDKENNSAVGEYLILAEERCQVLDENIRLLDDRREEINRNIQESCARLKHIHTKAESFRFRHFVSKHPIDSWSVVSTPF
ncbi:uncharacterized protein LOC116295285 [Actinia tenebrosa]|uniref:Uncharacterized protein LOC116295285 n=1 Tax=Actinia tenebrosa TaxID=6105 RepID=A0A6P8I213_ACTTE|nr:uncharacterized protein LOC116295285 [Actinia tenebrosa]